MPLLIWGGAMRMRTCSLVGLFALLPFAALAQEQDCSARVTENALIKALQQQFSPQGIEAIQIIAAQGRNAEVRVQILDTRPNQPIAHGYSCVAIAKVWREQYNNTIDFNVEYAVTGAGRDKYFRFISAKPR